MSEQTSLQQDAARLLADLGTEYRWDFVEFDEVVKVVRKLLARCAALEAENARLSAGIDTQKAWTQLALDAQARANAAEAENAALLGYVQHKPECASQGNSKMAIFACTCGLASHLAPQETP